MNKVFDTIFALSMEMGRFVEELEDNFGAPDLGEKLQYFQKRVQETNDSISGSAGAIRKEQNQDDELGCLIQMDCQEALEQLCTINEGSNPYDIIDVLRSVSSIITRQLPGQEFDSDDFYDPDDEMEARRISKMLSTPFKDEWD